MSHNEAAAFVIGEIRDASMSGWPYRVGRLYQPGHIEVSEIPGRAKSGKSPRGQFNVVVFVRPREGDGERIMRSLIAETVSIAAFTLLELWEEEPHDDE
jgi:hypothetical protein